MEQQYGPSTKRFIDDVLTVSLGSQTEGPTFEQIIKQQGNIYGGMYPSFIMRQGRGIEATEAVFCLQAKKPLPSGSFERRVPKINIYTFILVRCLLSALEPFFGHFSAARPRLVARLAPRPYAQR